MLNNGLYGGLAVAVSVTLAGCGVARADSPGDPGAYQGVVELDTYTLGFDLGGRVREVKVRRGDPVEVGTELALLDDAILVAARDARASDLAAAEAEVALREAGARPDDVRAARAQVVGLRAAEDAAAKAVARARALRDTSSIAQAEVDELEARLTRARAEREAGEARARVLAGGSRREEIAVAKARRSAAEAAVTLETERVTRARLHSTLKGSVLDVHVKPGEIVAPGTPAFTVADPTHPYVEVFVPQGALDGVAVGNRAELRVDGAKHGFSGEIEHVAPRAEFTPRYLFSERERPNLVLRVRVRVSDPAAELHAGTPTRVTLERRAGK